MKEYSEQLERYEQVAYEGGYGADWPADVGKGVKFYAMMCEEGGKRPTVTIYEESDFRKVENEMTDARAVEILESLPRGWFPYNKPEYGVDCKQSDIDNYEICLAIKRAISSLSRKEQEDDHAE